MKFIKTLVLTVAASALGYATSAGAAASLRAHPPIVAPAEKQRIFVLTDIGGEPDDSESMVRLMLYSSEIDIEGLVATTSIWLKTDTHPEAIRAVVEAYGKARPNLLLNATGYPTESELLRKIAVGQAGYGMSAVGKGKPSAGSDLLVKALEAPDPRPLWVSV